MKIPLKERDNTYISKETQNSASVNIKPASTKFYKKWMSESNKSRTTKNNNRPT